MKGLEKEKRDLCIKAQLMVFEFKKDGCELYMPPKSQTIWDYGIPNAQTKFGTAY